MTYSQLVIAEFKNNTLSKVTFEAIAVAKQLAPKEYIIGAIFGVKDMQSHAETLIKAGCDKVFVMEHPEFIRETTDAYSQALQSVIKEYPVQNILMGHTSFGQVLAPTLAQQLEMGIVSDVVDIACEDDFEFTIPIYAGKAFTKRILKENQGIVTIRPHNFSSNIFDNNRIGEIKYPEIDIQEKRESLIEQLQFATNNTDIQSSDIIIAGGRGMETHDHFHLLYELAELLGGTVGAARGASDEGFCDSSILIGQTGAKVTPKLYIACGISGATQHIAGMSGADIVVAINKDPEAMIFKNADYGIVGDVKEVIPELIKLLKSDEMRSIIKE